MSPIKIIPVSFFLLISLLGCSVFLFSQVQKEPTFWYFGYHAGMDFSGGPPVALSNGKINVVEGGATISDKVTGNLLFYTDGDTVWDKNHNAMPFGTGLWGSSSTTQSSVIVPKPGNNNLYYIFTADGATSGYPHGGKFAYSLVDMSQNTGLGDVIIKNTALYDTTCEKIAAIRHANGCYYWVLSHKFNSDKFYAYLVTDKGIKGPVITSIGFIPTTDQDCAGEMKFSPDAKHVAIATSAGNPGQGHFELFDFNNSTGILSNLVVLNPHPRAYGVSFSPNNQLLYNTWAVAGYVSQYDISSGVAATILASETIVDTLSPRGFAIQMGMDNKLYIAHNNGGALSVINNPNIPGVGCNVSSNAFNLLTQKSSSGLPNFVQSFFDTTEAPHIPLVAGINFSGSACFGEIINFTNASTGFTVYDSLLWSFDDPSSGVQNTSTAFNPSHIFSLAGNHNVKLFVANACYKDSVIIPLIIHPLPLVTASSDATICTGDSFSLSASGALTYGWTPATGLSATTGSIVIANPSPGNYSYLITGTDINGCTETATINIFVESALIADAGIDTIICKGNCIMLTATGGNTYSWNNGTSNSAIAVCPGTSTTYSVTVSNGNCKDEDEVTITVESCICESLYVPNAFSPNNDGQNDILYLKGDCIKSLKFIIYNRWGEKVFETNDIHTGWDGKTTGQEQNTAIFNYYLYVKLQNKESVLQKGNISLIR